MKKVLWNKMILSFFNGIALLAPLVITAALIRFLVFRINRAMLNPILKMLKVSGLGAEHVYLVKIAIFFAVIIGIVLIGRAARILVINRIFSWGEGVFLRVPILGRIYNAIKQISTAFLGQGKTIFKQVVLVEYPRKGLYSIGFVTGSATSEIEGAMEGNSGMNVFIPTTPNPTSGVFLVVPKEGVKALRMSVEDGMKYIVSGGSVKPDSFEGGMKDNGRA